MDNQTPEKIWESTLEQLQMQMTQATFDTWVKNTEVISVENGVWSIDAKSAFAKDWLENRLLSTIRRTIIKVLGQPVELKFVVATPPVPNEVTRADGRSYVVSPATNSGAADEGEEMAPTGINTAAPLLSDAQVLAGHIKTLGKLTGYQPSPVYYTTYWDHYLAGRWGALVGRRAYTLHQKLVALDVRKVTDADFTNWSPPVTKTYQELGRLLGVNYQAITGKWDYCWRYNEALKMGQPLTQCCGLYEHAHLQATQRGGQRCQFWRIGVFEVLFLEGLIAVAHVGSKTKNHQVRWQVWHSLPILTPWQAAFLPEDIRQQHRDWLVKYAPRLGFNLTDWEAISLLTAITLAPDYEQGRQLRGDFVHHPHWQEK